MDCSSSAQTTSLAQQPLQVHVPGLISLASTQFPVTYLERYLVGEVSAMYSEMVDLLAVTSVRGPVQLLRHPSRTEALLLSKMRLRVNVLQPMRAGTSK